MDNTIKSIQDLFSKSGTKRRAVGGLISLVALILVFGVATLAFLDINSTQAKFVLNSIDINKQQFDKNKERLNFTITNTTSGKLYEVKIANLWSEQTTVESHITVNSSDVVVFQRHLNKTTMPSKQNIINPTAEKLLNFTDSNATHKDIKVLFVTSNGNKCIIPIPSEMSTVVREC